MQRGPTGQQSRGATQKEDETKWVRCGSMGTRLMLPKPILLGWSSSTETSSLFSFLKNLDLHQDCKDNNTGKSCKLEGCAGMRRVGKEQNSTRDPPGVPASPLDALPLFPPRLPPCQRGQRAAARASVPLHTALCSMHGAAPRMQPWGSVPRCPRGLLNSEWRKQRRWFAFPALALTASPSMGLFVPRPVAS